MPVETVEIEGRVGRSWKRSWKRLGDFFRAVGRPRASGEVATDAVLVPLPPRIASPASTGRHSRMGCGEVIRWQAGEGWGRTLQAGGRSEGASPQQAKNEGGGPLGLSTTTRDRRVGEAQRQRRQRHDHDSLSRFAPVLQKSHRSTRISPHINEPKSSRATARRTDAGSDIDGRHPRLLDGHWPGVDCRCSH